MSPPHGGNLAWAAALADCKPSQLLDFSASINPLGPPAAVLAAIQAGLAQLIAYPNPHYPDLCAALAAHHGIDPEWVLPGNGSAELLTWAARELAALPTTYLITPAFGDYFRALHTFAGAIAPIPLSLSPTHPPTLPTADAASGLLINNPHNPTGLLLSRDRLLPYLDQFALVVVDEAFMDFLPPSEQQSLVDWVEQYPNMVILRSLTKFYSLPGLRLGYAIGHPDLLRRWQTWRDPWPVNQLAVVAAIAALQETAFQQQTWAWLPPVRQQLWQDLASIPGLTPYPGSANFLLVHSQQPVPDLQLTLLQQHHILIRDCLSFPELGDRYFRVAVRTAAENRRLVEGLGSRGVKGL